MSEAAITLISVAAPPVALLTLAAAQAPTVASVSQGPQGPPARPSTDPGNRSTSGSDGQIYTPELVTDPLAYYILAKA